MTELKMFVLLHKEVYFPRIIGFDALLVGAYNKDYSSKFAYTDAKGNNISVKNQNYCELTGLYWAWKNIDTDYIGFCHYRRFFSKKYYINETSLLTFNKIKSILDRGMIILPNPFYDKEKIKDCVRKAPNKNDLIEMENAIKDLCPDYLDSFRRYLNGNKTYLCNMFVMPKKLFNDYCEWLFPLLEYIEKRHNMSVEDPYRKRLFGFLSERLFNVWLIQNFDKKKIKNVNVVRIDESSFKVFISSIKNQIRNFQFKLKEIFHKY